MIFSVILFISFVVYACIILLVMRYWKRSKSESIAYQPKPVSLLVVYRNEERELPDLLMAIQNQKLDGSEVELVLVNDHSSDGSESLIDEWALVSGMRVKHLSLSDEKQGKKCGIEEGVEAASFDTILMCDADCVMEPHWVSSMSRTSQAQFAAGPVMFKLRQGLWQSFLQLDFISLIVLCGALIKGHKPVLANGANMMFSKASFKAVGGYAGNRSIASGDDVFLLERFVQNGYDISFVTQQEAMVYTAPPKTVSSFLNQRIRWAKKTKYAKGARNNFYIVGLTAFYAIYVLSILIAVLSNDVDLWQSLAIVVIAKTTIDCLFFGSILTFFRQQRLLKYVVLIQFIHPIYISTIAVLSLFNSYTWKERNYSHG